MNPAVKSAAAASPLVGTEVRTRAGGASSKSARTAIRVRARNESQPITRKYKSEEMCVDEEAEASARRKMTRSAVRASPARFREASLAAAVKRSRCETDRRSP